MRWELFFMMLLNNLDDFQLANLPMLEHAHVNPDQLKDLIRSGKLNFGGNAKLKIYGTFSCSSGKRMKKENRVFFATEQEALSLGYRPCAHCLNKKYQVWKNKPRKNQVENARHTPHL